MAANPRSISAVVPVYNSSDTLETLVTQLDSVLATISPNEYEIILVDDGSLDSSWLEIRRLAPLFPSVTGIHLSRNFGQHNALLAGIRAAQFDVIVTLDDDLQNPPEEIGRLLDELESGFDLVLGLRSTAHRGAVRNSLTTVTKMVLGKVLGMRSIREFSAFRAFRTELREAFAGYQGPYVSIDVLLMWGTTRISSITVEHRQRLVGRSNYSFRKLVKHTIDMVTFYSTVPLQFASWLGFATTACGAVLVAYVLIRYATGTTLQGFTFLASVILIFSGAQLFVLGIIGEYLARVHFRAVGRPSYLIQTTVGRGGGDQLHADPRQ